METLEKVVICLSGYMMTAFFLMLAAIAFEGNITWEGVAYSFMLSVFSLIGYSIAFLIFEAKA